MTDPHPHYWLYLEAGEKKSPFAWKFILREAAGAKRYEISDIEEVEEYRSGDRLELLTLIRALEYLDQPSKVTLTRCSAAIRQGIQYGLAEWRSNNWEWEFFGQMAPVKNHDLWRRLDHLLDFHRIDFGLRRFDLSERAESVPQPHRNLSPTIKAIREAFSGWKQRTERRVFHNLMERFSTLIEEFRRRLTVPRAA